MEFGGVSSVRGFNPRLMAAIPWGWFFGRGRLSLLGGNGVTHSVLLRRRVSGEQDSAEHRRRRCRRSGRTRGSRGPTGSVDPIVKLQASTLGEAFEPKFSFLVAANPRFPIRRRNVCRPLSVPILVTQPFSDPGGRPERMCSVSRVSLIVDSMD